MEPELHDIQLWVLRNLCIVAEQQKQRETNYTCWTSREAQGWCLNSDWYKTLTGTHYHSLSTTLHISRQGPELCSMLKAGAKVELDYVNSCQGKGTRTACWTVLGRSKAKEPELHMLNREVMRTAKFVYRNHFEKSFCFCFWEWVGTIILRNHFVFVFKLENNNHFEKSF